MHLFLLFLSCMLERTPPNVILIVMDTVRSDHMSVCGYGRPTTPTLEKLKQEGAEIQCDSIAPGSWTLPSHASFFTGTEPIVHRAHAITSGIKSLEGTKARSRKLNKKLPTLAEKMKDKGYHTAALSANPVVSEGLGLLRGFQQIEVAEKFGRMHGDKLLTALRKELQSMPREKPIFLFVNIADAHQPWVKVPEGVGWASKTNPIYYDKGKPENPWRRFVDERMSETERNRFQEDIVDLYDYGLFKADENLAGVLDLLTEQGIRQDDTRVIIVSDHGEFLGEFGVLDHGHYVYDENVRVPLITLNIDGGLPRFINAVHSYDLALNGKLPEKLLPSRTAAWPHVRRCARTGGRVFCDTWAAMWAGEEKLIWRTGEFFTVSSKGGTEVLTKWAPPADHSLVAYASQVEADSVDTKAPDMDADVLEMLRAAGYVE